MPQGGIGPAGLSAEDLHVLDLTQPRPRWHRLRFPKDMLACCLFVSFLMTIWSYY